MRLQRREDGELQRAAIRKWVVAHPARIPAVRRTVGGEAAVAVRRHARENETGWKRVCPVDAQTIQTARRRERAGFIPRTDTRERRRVSHELRRQRTGDRDRPAVRAFEVPLGARTPGRESNLPSIVEAPALQLAIRRESARGSTPRCEGDESQVAGDGGTSETDSAGPGYDAGRHEAVSKLTKGAIPPTIGRACRGQTGAVRPTCRHRRQPGGNRYFDRTHEQ